MNQYAHNQSTPQYLAQTERTMLFFIGKIIGTIVQIILFPFVVAFAIPMGIINGRRRVKQAMKYGILFTGDEISLLLTAQDTIKYYKAGLIKNKDVIQVAECIENARMAYQLVHKYKEHNASFSEFVLPLVEKCYVGDWDKVNRHFNLFDLKRKVADPVSDVRAPDAFDDDIPF